jgi:hypothetical protein
VLGDPEQGANARTTAAVQLGTERRPENQELLLRHLDTREAPVFTAVAQALGRIGDEKALERLERAEAPEDAAARRAHAFARSLIAYRLRLGRHLIPLPPDADLVEVSQGIPLEPAKADPETVKQALGHVREDLPAVPLAAEGAVTLVCRSTRLLLAFTAGFATPESRATLGERSALPLVLLKKGLSLDRWFLEGYFFTHPSGGGRGGKEVALLGTRPGGHLTYAGKVRVREKEWTFTLRSVDTRYAPAIEVEGRYDRASGSLEFRKAVTSGQVAARKNRAATPRKASPSLG